MLLGYNTNGWAHHRLEDAIDLLAEIGYRSVAITVDYHALDPDGDWQSQLTRVAERLQRHGMTSVIETGARFLLDPRRKHYPTLLCADAAARNRRLGLLKHAVHCAASLGSRCVSLWSGSADDDTDPEQLWTRLVGELEWLCHYAERLGVTLGFEPEPGMFISTMQDFAELRKRCPFDNLRLTLDVGHLHCQGEGPIEEIICQWSACLVNMHIEDMRRGIHEHLMFGEGEMQFVPIMRGIRRSGYQGPVHVELSRHSHEAPTAARKAFDFLHRAWQEAAA